MGIAADILRTCVPSFFGVIIIISLRAHTLLKEQGVLCFHPTAIYSS